MAFAKPAIEEVSGFLGIGSLEILGVFFILDGTSGFLAFIEAYAKTSAWAILVTVPVLVVAYVFGIISSLGVQAFLEKLLPSELTPTLFRAVSESKNDALMQKYLDAERHSLLLHGCVAGFLLLAVGSWAEVPMMAPFGFVGYIGLIGGAVVAVLCPLLARRIQRQVAVFAHAITGPASTPQASAMPPNPAVNTDAAR
jgi:sterol desaturase/sphingolipid hydroxylase (fatty acid hydroxylase superfamily)